MTSRTFTVVLGMIGLIGIYLFVTAPEKLPGPKSLTSNLKIPIEQVFRIIAQQQSIARTIYTSEIVGPGKKAGLKFGENWKNDVSEEGPLPALLLREIAKNITKTNVPIALFLGSDFPIAPSNKFIGHQAEQFKVVKRTRRPVFFKSADTDSHIAMFPDFSKAQPCVSCHNSHPDSEKTDWTTEDVMGATTWAYPKGEVSPDELVEMVYSVRLSLEKAYSSYLEKVKGLNESPEIGKSWPRDGFFLPSVDVFMAEVDRQGGGEALSLILEALKAK
jgi:adenylate cyclase